MDEIQFKNRGKKNYAPYNNMGHIEKMFSYYTFPPVRPRRNQQICQNCCLCWKRCCLFWFRGSLIFLGSIWIGSLFGFMFTIVGSLAFSDYRVWLPYRVASLNSNRVASCGGFEAHRVLEGCYRTFPASGVVLYGPNWGTREVIGSGTQEIGCPQVPFRRGIFSYRDRKSVV